MGNNSMYGLVAILFVIGLIAITALGSIAIIGAGQRGVLLTYGKVEDKILPEGITTITPFMNQVVAMSVQTQKYASSASSASKDLQIVSTEVTLNYHLDAGKVNKIYQQLGVDFQDRVITPAIQESVKASTAEFTAEELITKRAIVKAAIENALTGRLADYGIIMETVSITDFDFSPEFNAAIEQKVTAEQLALKAGNDLKRITIEAEQKVAQAKGEAEATLTKAKAEAEAIRITSEALQNNKNLVNWEYVKKFDGKLPTTLIIGGETPSLILPMVNQ